MSLEIERKFRVLAMENVELPEGCEIQQGYLANTPNTVRVRVIGGKALLTIKCPPSGPKPDTTAVVSQEFEYEIPLEDAKALLAVTTAQIHKTRYRFANGVELDVFHGAHEGFVMAEFESSDGAQPPAIPGISWVEVSSDRRYSNSWISRNGVPPVEET